MEKSQLSVLPSSQAAGLNDSWHLPQHLKNEHDLEQ